MSSVLDLARPELLTLRPYAHAAWDPALERLHANELPWRPAGDQTNAGLNRYPEPYPHALVARLAQLYGVQPIQVLAGRGSDEAIDLLTRAFCRAGRDSVLICPPTFGMYKVAAQIQGAGVVEAPLLRERGYALDEDGVLQHIRADDGVKIVFLCSPGNPTGNLLDAAAVERICAACSGRAVVAVDEAYVEFSAAESFITRLGRYSNLVVMRTLSKAYALAGARCGTLIGDPAVVELLGRLLPPYALPSPTIEAVGRALDPEYASEREQRVDSIKQERARVSEALTRLPVIRTVWPSEANFLLVDCMDAGQCLHAARQAGLLVRDLRLQSGMAQALRISLGTPEQNTRLLRALQTMSPCQAPR